MFSIILGKYLRVELLVLYGRTAGFNSHNFTERNFIIIIIIIIIIATV